MLRPPPQRGAGTGKAWLAGGAVVLATAGVLGLVTPGFLVTRVFDGATLAQGVRQTLTEDYRLTVSEVTCPPDVEVAADASFDCTATVDGHAVRVPARVVGVDGRYEVGRPS